MRRCQMPGAAAAPCCRLFSVLPAAVVRSFGSFAGPRRVDGGGQDGLILIAIWGKVASQRCHGTRRSLDGHLKQPFSESRVASSLSEIASFCFFLPILHPTMPARTSWTEAV